jgi:hypothetical protein
MERNLTDRSQKLIGILLTDPKIAEKVFMDVEHREAYKILDINQDGTLTLGKRSVRWWNKIFNLEKTISFRDFAFSTFSALVGMANNLDKNKILQGLSRELIAKSVLDKNFDFVVDRLFDSARYAVKSGVLNTVATPANGEATPESDQVIDQNVRVILENGGMIPIYDSFGRNSRNNVLLRLKLKVDGYTCDPV